MAAAIVAEAVAEAMTAAAAPAQQRYRVMSEPACRAKISDGGCQPESEGAGGVAYIKASVTT